MNRSHSHRLVTRRTAATIFATLLLGLLLPIRIQADVPSLANAKPAPAELGMDDHMKAMGKALKQLRKAAQAGTLTPDMAKLAVEMESHAVIAKTMMPPNAMNLSGPDQTAFVLGFRKKMIETIGQMLQLETALIENRQTDAQNLIGDLIKSMKEGHSTFNKKEKM